MEADIDTNNDGIIVNDLGVGSILKTFEIYIKIISISKLASSPRPQLKINKMR